MALDPTTAERLVRLRTLLTYAVARASDTTAPGQHTAVIALDGVCEQALLLAASERGLSVREKDSLLDVHNKLSQELPSWGRPGSKAVVELHRSRNNVQHHGVLPASDHLPIWLPEVERYISSLVHAVFGVSLDDVHVADAVDDPDLREKLREAELALAADDSRTSLRHSVAALDYAIRRFRESRYIGDSHLGTITRFDEFRKIEQTLKRVDDFVDLAYLAVDPAEGLWLRALERRHWGADDAPSHDEARRAFAFSLSWALRWEAFKARQPGPRPPRLEPDLDSKHAEPKRRRVTACEDTFVRSGERELLIELENVPIGWLRHVGDAQSTLRARGDHGPLVLVQAGSGETLRLTVSEEASAADVGRLVDLVIQETHRVFTEGLEERREQRDGAIAAANDYRTRVSQSGTELISEVAPDLEREDSPVGVRLQLALPDDVRVDLIRPRVAAAAKAEGFEHGGIGFSYRDGYVHVTPDFTPADSLVQWLAHAVEEERAAREAARRNAEQRAREAEAFIAELNAG